MAIPTGNTIRLGSVETAEVLAPHGWDTIAGGAGRPRRAAAPRLNQVVPIEHHLQPLPPPQAPCCSAEPQPVGRCAAVPAELHRWYISSVLQGRLPVRSIRMAVHV